MENTENLISDNLLFFLREKTGEPKIDYEIPLSQLQGGFDTSIFKFKLKNIHPALLKPLVLRVFRKSHPLRQAMKENIIRYCSVPYVST